MSLYPHQHEAAAFHLKARYSLNFSEMGTGKSRMALATAKAAGASSVLVFGPSFLRAVWEGEAEAMETGLRYLPYSQLKAGGEYLEDFWIADEVHYLKNPEAKRTAVFYAALKERRPDYFIGLTGTPIKNRVPDLWTLLGFCSLCPEKSNGIRLSEMHPRYYAFARHFCEVKRIEVHGRVVEKFGALKADKVEELKALLRGKANRYLLADVVADLPEMTRRYIKAAVSPSDGLAAEFEAYIAGRKADSKAKHLSATLKAPWTERYVRSLMDGGSGPVVVFSDHVAPVAYLAEHLGALAVDGSMAAPYRAEVVRRFQEGGVPVLAATIGSLSVGVTLTAARHVVFNDLSWVPGDNLQAEKRIHRIGQKNACTAHYIEASETDAYIRRTLEEKQAASDRTL